MSRRLLFVAPFPPRHDGQHGGTRVIYGLAAALAERHELVLVHLDPGETPADPDLVTRCASVHPVAAPQHPRWTRRPRYAAALLRGESLKAVEWGVPELRRRVRTLSERLAPDVVQVEFGVIGDVLAAAGGALRVVTVHDPAVSIRESASMRPPALPLVHRLDAAASLREERRVLRTADAAVAFTERDRRLLLAHQAPGVEVVTIPPGWDVPARPLDPGAADPPLVVFVGNFRHPPNIDAAVRLARVILPRVQSARPDVVLELVGANPPREVYELAGQGVRVTGAVASVRPYLERASLVVAPLWIGGGVRVKVLEALAAGKCVLATPRAVEGISARPGHELIVAESDERLAAMAIELLGDENRRLALARRARLWAERELSWAAMADRYDALYDRLEQERRR